MGKGEGHRGTQQRRRDRGGEKCTPAAVPDRLAPGAWRAKLDSVLQRISAHGVMLEKDSCARLEIYCQAVFDWSERAGLVSPGDLRDLVEKHVAPSLGPLLAVPVVSGEDWIDVGSGAGLPGLVIKLCRPEIRMTLIDSSRKKTIFLDSLKQKFQLHGLSIIEGRVESMPRSGAGPCATGQAEHLMANSAPSIEPWGPHRVILMRAVASLEKSLSLVDALATDRTRLVTFKGPGWRSEVESSRELMERLGWVLVETLQIPWAKPKLLLLERRPR